MIIKVAAAIIIIIRNRQQIKNDLLFLCLNNNHPVVNSFNIDKSTDIMIIQSNLGVVLV